MCVAPLVCVIVSRRSDCLLSGFAQCSFNNACLVSFLALGLTGVVPKNKNKT